MIDKIRKCINDSYEGYGDFRGSTAIELLNNLFKEELLSFSSFCTENYLYKGDNMWEVMEIPVMHTTEELLDKFLKNKTK